MEVCTIQHIDFDRATYLWKLPHITYIHTSPQRAQAQCETREFFFFCSANAVATDSSEAKG